MKRTTAIALLFMMSLSTLVFVGCTAVSNRHTYDQLPDNVPKGYVEFYANPKKFRWSIWKYQNGKFEELEDFVWRQTGGPIDMLVQEQRRRIAEQPGLHTFQVRAGTAIKEVKVEVIEGMITPVSILIYDIKEVGSGYNERTFSFNMSLSVEKPTPFVK